MRRYLFGGWNHSVPAIKSKATLMAVFAASYFLFAAVWLAFGLWLRSLAWFGVGVGYLLVAQVLRRQLRKSVNTPKPAIDERRTQS